MGFELGLLGIFIDASSPDDVNGKKIMENNTVLALNSVNGFTKHPELLNISCGPEFFWAFAMLKISDIIAPDLINISIY